MIKSPEDASEAQVKYISEFTQSVIDELASGSKPEHADLTSFIQNHLISELGKNADFLRHSSTYFYKECDEDILHAGPVWDFDATFGCHIFENDIDYQAPTGYACEQFATWYTDNAYYQYAYKKFFKKVFLPQAKGLVGKNGKASVASVSQIKKMIRKSALMERTFHPVEKAFHIDKHFPTWGNSMGYTQKWLKTRIKWLTAQL